MHRRIAGLLLLLVTSGGCAQVMKNIGLTQAPDNGTIEAAFARKDEAWLAQTCTEWGKSAGLACVRHVTLQFDKLAAAHERGDGAYLKAVCDGVTVLDVKYSDGTDPHFIGDGRVTQYPAVAGLPSGKHSNARDAACGFAAKSQGADELKRWRADLASCRDPQASYTTWSQYAFPPLDKARADWGITPWDMLAELAVAMGKCGPAGEDLVVESVMAQGKDNMGQVAAKAMFKRGVDFEQVVLSYLKRRKDAPFAAVAAGNHWMVGNNIGNSLRLEKRFGGCDTWAQVYPKAPDLVQAGLLLYVGDARCTGGLSVAVGKLAHARPDIRADACYAVARLGTKADAPKLDGLARTDPYWEWRDGVKAFPVQEACAKAVNDLKAR